MNIYNDYFLIGIMFGIFSYKFYIGIKPAIKELFRKNKK